VRSRWMALLLSPIGLLLISAARLLIISDYSTTTAVTIASSGGYVNTLLGSIVPLVPVFMPYIALGLLASKHFVLSMLALLFTAFMSPTQLKLPITRHLIEMDQYRIAAEFQRYWIVTLAVAAIIALAVHFHHKSAAETLGVLAAIALIVGLFILPSVHGLRVPSSLNIASADDRSIIDWVVRNWKWALLIALGVVILFESYRRGIASTISTAVALAAAIALVPYIVNIYPLPHRSDYYFAVLHQPWLPAEDITLASGRKYAAFVLTSDDDWFTVLTTSRRSILYIPTDKIVSRTVCQAHAAGAPIEYQPLITLLYSAPARAVACRVRTR
jgi:hypothetical protein